MAVLGEPRDKMEEFDVPGNTKGRIGSGNLGVAGGVSCGEEGGLKLAEDFPRAYPGTRVSPTGGKRGRKLRAICDPLWNT